MASLNPSFRTGTYQPQSSAMISSVAIPCSESFCTRYSARRLPHSPGLICSSSPSYGGNLDDRNSTCVFIARHRLTGGSQTSTIHYPSASQAQEDFFAVKKMAEHD